MNFTKTVIGNDIAQAYLQKQIKNGTVAQANLWIGPDHCGKTTLFENIVFDWLCQKPAEKKPCLRCAACRMLNKNIHPNVVSLKATEKRIGLDEVQQLLNQAPRSGFLPGPRLMLIQGAERLTREASNALLKALEEPQAKIYWFLLANSDDGLLPTILSRCAILWFYASDTATIAKQFPELGAATRLAHGLPGVANWLSSKTHADQLVKNAGAWLDIISASTFSERYRRLQTIAPKSYTSSTLTNDFELALVIIHDVLLTKLNLPNQCQFQMLRQSLESFSQTLTTQQLWQAQVTLLKAITNLQQTTIQPRLLLDYTLLNLYHRS